MTARLTRHEPTTQLANPESVTLTPESLIDSLGPPVGIEDVVLDISRPRDLGRAADFD